MLQTFTKQKCAPLRGKWHFCFFYFYIEKKASIFSGAHVTDINFRYFGDSQIFSLRLLIT